MNTISGWLVNKIGSKIVFTFGLFLGIICTSLIPTASYVHSVLVMFLRVLTGLGVNVMFPVAYATCSNWGSREELGTLLSINLAGIQFGAMVTLIFSGLECQYLNWVYVFYLSSAAGFVILLMWLVFYVNDPTESRLISEDEEIFILAYAKRSRARMINEITPYIDILKCPAVWSCMIASAATGTINFMTSFLPTYFNDVLSISVDKNGFFSACPWIAMLVGRLIFGPLSDQMYCFKTRGDVMKLFNTIGFGFSSLGLFAMTFITHESPQNLLLTLIFLLYFFFMAVSGGFFKCPLYIAPQHSSFIGSILMACNMASNIILPYVVGAMTPNGTEHEWHNVFYVGAIAGAIGAVIFLILGTGEMQSWAGTGVKPEKLPKLSTVSFV